MSLTRFLNIPQPLFPNQRNDEAVYVFTRRHFIDFALYGLLFGFLALFPLVFVFIGGDLFPVVGLSRVAIVDFSVLLAMIYYLMVAVVFLVAWLSYYYSVFIVTDERIVEITQRGLFGREVQLMIFEQIEDVSCKTRGLWNTLFNVGSIEIQTAGAARNFSVKRLPRPYLIMEIIHELSYQAKSGVKMRGRYPDLAVIGLIHGLPVAKSGRKPPVMNLNKSLEEVSSRYRAAMKNPKTLREKFDWWWWTHTNQMLATFGAEAAKGKPENPRSRADRPSKAKEDADMVDL